MTTPDPYTQATNKLAELRRQGYLIKHFFIAESEGSWGVYVIAWISADIEYIRLAACESENQARAVRLLLDPQIKKVLEVLESHGGVVDMPASSEMGVPVIKVPCEVYSRIVGYLRPTEGWNEGKQQEFKDRKVFHVSGRE